MLASAGMAASAAVGAPGSADVSSKVDRDRTAAPVSIDSRAGKERGTHFEPSDRSTVTALRYYRAEGDTSAHRARLWDPAGKPLAEVVLPARQRPGWQRVRLAAPVKVRPGKRYAVSVALPAGTPILARRPAAESGSDWEALGGARGTVGSFPARQLKRTHFLVRPVLGDAPATTSPTPPESPPALSSSSGYPDASNTGPSGTLTDYTGPMVITRDGTVIDSKVVRGYLRVNAADVIIENSHVIGQIDNWEHPRNSLTISDSLVEAASDGSEVKAVRNHNLLIERTEITGSVQSIDCNDNCTIVDSWLHGQVSPGQHHGDGFLSNGGSGFTLRHNTLACDAPANDEGGACSAAVAMYDDFGPITDVVIDNNLFKASPAGYCLYAGNGTDFPASNVDITNNVFERGPSGKCGVYGAVVWESRPTDPASTWSGNTWDNGRPVR